MCYNCEGEVDLDVIVCPFCAADLREEKPEQQRGPGAQSVKQIYNEQSLYPPPYSKPVEQVMPMESDPVLQHTVEEESTPVKSTVSAVALITLGVQFFLFSLFLLFFHHNGALILKWDASLWFLYFFASIPLLIFGYRALSKI